MAAFSQIYMPVINEMSFYRKTLVITGEIFL
jgi:hypothetical protein